MPQTDGTQPMPQVCRETDPLYQAAEAKLALAEDRLFVALTLFFRTKATNFSSPADACSAFASDVISLLETREILDFAKQGHDLASLLEALTSRDPGGWGLVRAKYKLPDPSCFSQADAEITLEAFSPSQEP